MYNSLLHLKKNRSYLPLTFQIDGALPNKYTVYEVTKDASQYYQPISYASEVSEKPSTNLDFDYLNKVFNNKIKYV